MLNEETTQLQIIKTWIKMKLKMSHKSTHMKFEHIVLSTLGTIVLIAHAEMAHFVKAIMTINQRLCNHFTGIHTVSCEWMRKQIWEAAAAPNKIHQWHYFSATHIFGINLFSKATEIFNVCNLIVWNHTEGKMECSELFYWRWITKNMKIDLN